MKRLFTTLPLWFLMITSILFSCSRIDDMENRLDVLEQKVETLEQAVSALQFAYEGGKIITGVDDLDNGYKITFSDNSTIDINHGDNIISSITQDNVSGAITITMADGDSFTFNQKRIIPTSIAILDTKPLMIGKEGTVSFEFRVNPSNASFDYNVESEGCEILLDFVAETRTYVTTPSNYKLSKVEPVYNEQGVMKVGQYKAYITDLGLNTVYKDLVALVSILQTRMEQM
mgnify:CR=1 FL=1